jgi:hypothetical protein
MIILIDMMARPFVVAKKRKQMPVNEEHQVTKLPTTWVRAMKWLLHLRKIVIICSQNDDIQMQILKNLNYGKIQLF